MAVVAATAAEVVVAVVEEVEAAKLDEVVIAILIMILMVIIDSSRGCDNSRWLEAGNDTNINDDSERLQLLEAT